MSYGKLHHGNPSAYTLNQDYGHLSSDEDSTHSDAGSENGQCRDSNEGYELKSLSTRLNSSQQRPFEPGRSVAHPAFDEDDHLDEIHVDKGRRGSTSTTHSFMLYTPDEERTVIRKLDRRLVLFVAFLYMLSFLDRSSMSGFSPSAMRRSF